MHLYPHSKGGWAYYHAHNKQVKIAWVWLALLTCRRVPKTFGALAKMEHHVSRVIRALLDGE